MRVGFLINKLDTKKKPFIFFRVCLKCNLRICTKKHRCGLSSAIDYNKSFFTHRWPGGDFIWTQQNILTNMYLKNIIMFSTFYCWVLLYFIINSEVIPFCMKNLHIKLHFDLRVRKWLHPVVHVLKFFFQQYYILYIILCLQLLYILLR